MNEGKASSEKIGSFGTLLTREPLSLPRIITYVISITAICFSTYHLFVGFLGQPNAHEFRSTHLSFMLILCFLCFPFLNHDRSKFSLALMVDLLLIGLTISTLVYVLYDTDAFLFRTGNPNLMDIVMGTILIGLVIEATRRATGLVLSIIVTLLLIYPLFADKLFWFFAGPSTPWKTIVDYNFLQNEGIYGIPLGVISSYVVLFFIFSSLLLQTGVGKYFINFALALSGHRQGGPAKVSVISSAIFGSVTGVATANVATTGTFTIPLMMRAGYSPVFAGAVEAAASTGGQFMPPIMGAAAFVIAEFMGVPYLEVCIAAALPSILFSLSVFMMVHFRARKLNLSAIPKDELPSLKEVCKKGFHLIIPLFVIIIVLVSGRSPAYAAVWAIVSVAVLSFVRRETWITPVKMLSALEVGAKTCISVSLTCAAVGIIICTAAITGIGLSFISAIIKLSAGQLWIALVLIMIASLILGMGMTAVAVYITLAALVIPALVELGVPTIAAHLFPFYYGIISVVTPPVALAAFVACGLSKADPTKTGFQAFRLSIAAFVIPFMFVYGPELLMVGTPFGIIRAVISSSLGIVLLAASVEGMFVYRMGFPERIISFAASVLLIKSGIITDIFGLLVLVGLYFYQKLRYRAAKAAVQT